MTDTLEADLKAAMQAHDERRVATLRLLKAALINARIAVGHELSESEAIAVLQKEAKQRQETAALYTEKNQPERAAAEKSEYDIIAAYLPKPLSDSELDALVTQAITKTGADSPAQMGMVMAELKSATAGRVDGGALANRVRQALSGSQPSA